MPVVASASFLSSIFGDQAYAAKDQVEGAQSHKNSQNIALLQANVSSASIIQEKNDKQKDSKGSDGSNGKMDSNADLNIVSDNALSPTTGPMGASDGKN